MIGQVNLVISGFEQKLIETGEVNVMSTWARSKFRHDSMSMKKYHGRANLY